MGEYLQAGLDLWASFRSTMLGAAVTSYPAQLLAAWAAILFIASSTVFVARRPLNELDDATTLDAIEKRIRMRGSKPGREESIENQRLVKRERAWDYVTCVIGKISITVLLGIGVPLALLAFVTANADWFFNAQPILATRDTGVLVSEPGFKDLSLYVVDLFIRGGVSDLAEVFGWEIASVEHAREHSVYTALVFLFRLTADVFAVLLLVRTPAIFINWRRVVRKVDLEAKERLARLEGEQAPITP